MKDFKLKVKEFEQKTKKFKEIEKQYQELKKEFARESEEFFKTHKDEVDGKYYTFGSKLGEFKVTEVKRSKVEFDIDAIEAKIDKDLYNAFIDKLYVINDWPKFISLMKSKGISKKEIAKLLNVQKSINKDKLNQLSDIGEIDMEDLSGCYKVVPQATSYQVKFIANEK
jgi:hypothetical protein